VDGAVAAGVVAVAAAGWWWSVRMSTAMTSAGDPEMGPRMGETAIWHTLAFGGFLVAWLAMMAAMMFPAIAPVLSLYRRAAVRRRVVPVPFFAAGYLIVWGACTVPAYAAWRALQDPLANGAT
jgi:predicted metal-binding membrane protein